MTDYTEQELRQMQEEALQRLRQMQEQAQRTARQNGWEGSSPQPPQPSPPPADASDPFRGQISSPLSGLMQWAGGERGILLALLAVLMGEGADPALLLALFYLAMFDDPSETK
ncbi:MAG: hypothetical protein IJY02_05150 [Oscillospiraceae bacterium]|nr:hypothetical protein [Oscillospiraceae bacterium]